MKPSLQKLIKDSYYAKHVPAFIQIYSLALFLKTPPNLSMR